jgi:hypothetical protein
MAMPSSRMLLLAVLLSLAAWPTASDAATVSSDEFCDAGVDTTCEVTANYEAAPGEVNTVSASTVDSTHVRFEDSTATLTAGAGCTLDTAHQATCTQTRSFTDVLVELGDQADLYSMSSTLTAFVKAGPGNDTVFGGLAADNLDGGGGIDTLKGRAGDDRLFDGDTTASPDSDVLDGGSGNDRVEYWLRTAPVIVDLNAPNTAGQAGENDKLLSIEGAQGGSAADTLTGNDEANDFIGYRGADVIDGRGGNDTIDGGKTQKGGAGDDTLTGVEKSGTVACGDGADLVGPDLPARKLSSDCESVVIETGDSGRHNVLTSRGPLKALKGNRFVFRFRCVKGADTDCSGKASVLAGGKTVGRASVPKIKPGKRAEVGMTLPASIAAKIRGKGVNATFAFKPKGGRSAGYTTLMRLG